MQSDVREVSGEHHRNTLVPPTDWGGKTGGLPHGSRYPAPWGRDVAVRAEVAVGWLRPKTVYVSVCFSFAMDDRPLPWLGAICGVITKIYID